MSYKLWAYAYKPELVRNEDWPEIDDYFHNLILWGAGQEVLPSFGKNDVARSFENMYAQRIREYRSSVDMNPGLTQTFSDVQMGATGRIGPWIPGVDFGLAR